MNPYKLPISSSSSSSEEDRRAQRERENKEIDDLITTASSTYLPHLVSVVTPRLRPGRRQPHAERDREAGHIRLYNDYFADQPVYHERFFRRRFRMRRHLFIRIMEAVTRGDEWFQQKRDATGRLGLSPLQKCTAAIRMLAYGVAADQVDEYVRISESTARSALGKFCEGVIREFGREYLRRPTPEDLARLLHSGEQRGFPGMIGSIDCMHWEWKNCPAAWKGQFQGREGVATLVLEAVADRDLWIWHTFFGMPGSANDITVLHRSPVFRDVLEGRAPPVNFVVNGNEYNLGYYLTDGIYPKWATFVKSITNPLTPKEKLFAQHQEAARKDVERAFGVLQARFAIVRNPALAWSKAALHRIMLACVIMHNMIVEDERETYANYADTTEFIADRPRPNRTDTMEEGDSSFRYNTNRIVDINIYLENKNEVESQHTHLRLRDDLMEHIWQNFQHNLNLS